MEFVHGTSSTFLDDIMENGLLPPDTTGNSTEKRIERLDGIHLLAPAHVRLAGAYALRAAKHFGGEPVILSGDVPDAAIRETLPGGVHHPDIYVVPYLPAVHIEHADPLDPDLIAMGMSELFKAHKS